MPWLVQNGPNSFTLVSKKCKSEILFHSRDTAHTGSFHNWISVFRSKYYPTRTSCLENKQNKQKQTTTKLTEIKEVEQFKHHFYLLILMSLLLENAPRERREHWSSINLQNNMPFTKHYSHLSLCIINAEANIPIHLKKGSKIVLNCIQFY